MVGNTVLRVNHRLLVLYKAGRFGRESASSARGTTAARTTARTSAPRSAGDSSDIGVFRKSAEVFFQHFQRDCHRAFQLRIMSFAYQLWIEIHFDIGRYAMVLDFPFPAKSIERPPRRCDSAP